jgi:radical SAM superfamily enzyme YgiQ (UPF0313 family)
MQSEETPLRIGFVNLRARTKDWHHIIMVPLGVMYLSSALKKAFGTRVEVKVFDVTVFPERQDPDEAIREWIATFRPHVLGLRGFTSQADEFPIIARIAKSVDPSCLVIAGGPHASTNSTALHQTEGVDLVCPYEGEETLIDIVRHLLEGRSPREVAGVGWWNGTEVVRNPPRPSITDLDALPFPDYDVIDLDAYQGRIAMTDFMTRGRFTSLFTSRGCYYRCSYCHTNFGKRVRYRSVQNVLDEIQYLVEERGVREFHIIDDIFNADKERAIAIFNGVVRKNWKISFAFPNGLRADRMDEEFVAAAKEAGTYHWALAVETASPRLQKLVQKHNKLDKVFDTIALSDRYGIFTCTFNMLGFPTETEEEMQATIDFTLRSAAHMTFFFVVTPYEGTTLYETLERFGIHPEDLDPEQLGYHNFSGNDEHGSLCRVPRSRMQTLIVDAVKSFYFDGRRMQRMMDLNHNHAHLALHLETRRWSAGYDFHTIPDPRAARLLAQLFRTAREIDPARCGHLPEPPPIEPERLELEAPGAEIAA